MSFYNFYDNNNGYNTNNNLNFNPNNNPNNSWQGQSSNFNSSNSSATPSQDDIKNTYEKYRGYNQNELYNEFIKETAKQRASGSLTPEKLNQIKSTILPYLSEKEQETLNKILNDIM